MFLLGFDTDKKVKQRDFWLLDDNSLSLQFSCKVTSEARIMSARNQYKTAFCVSLLSLGYGLSTGWTSAAIPLLQSPDSPLPVEITKDEVSLIGSVLTIGGFVGTLTFGYASNKFGRKKTIFSVAFPQIIGWILMFFAESALLLILFRFLAGFAAGGIFTVVPVFISEISEDR